jgi:hypothetical protein
MAIPDRPTAESLVWPGHAPQPYDMPMYRIGRRGLNVQDAIDDLDPGELSRMVNVVSKYGEPLTVRTGQTALATTAGGERVHSLFRLNDPAAGAFARFAGSNANLFRGTTGALTNVDSGYSGDPLSFCGVNMPLSGTPYVVIGDRSRNRKISRTGAVEVYGIPPGVLTSTALLGQSRKEICTFDAADPNGSSAAATWVANAGVDRSTPPNASGAPVVIDVFAAQGVQATTVVGAAATGYSSFISHPIAALNLDFLDLANTIAASDDDQTHILFNVSDPQYLEEIKIYFVLDPVFIAGFLPGTAGGNGNAWFKSFRPNDLQNYFEFLQSGLDASDNLRLRTLLEQFKTEQPGDDRLSLINATGGRDLNRQDIPQIAAGRNIWGEFGILGVPLRRGEWQRMGTPTPTGTVGWNTVTGIVIAFQTNTNQPIQFQFDSWFLYGGSGPDASDVGASPYDVRVVNYHPVNGSKGNPSAVQAETAWLNPLRQTIRVTPTASGTAALRQQAYVRGGDATGTTDWFFAGQNAADGGTIDVTVADDTRITDEALEIDNDMPVTSVNASGATVLNQLVTTFFMVEQYVFALGDPLQPGRLYRSKLGFPEQWPAAEFKDVCAATEELMSGGSIGSAGFVFSRTRMYSILLNADGSWDTEPTQCHEGLVSRWALALTPYGIAFGSPFGVRLTQGAAPEPLSDENLGKLFKGVAVNGFNPVDYSVPTAYQLAYHDDELWVSYQDTGGTRRQLIYNFKDKTWRSYLFAEPVATCYSEPVQGVAGTLLLGGNATGQVYTHSGFSDDGAAIAWTARTGCDNWGKPFQEKLWQEIRVTGDIGTATITAQAFLNDEGTTVAAQSIVGVVGNQTYSFEPFGSAPMRARNVSVELRGNAPTGAGLALNLAGVSRHLEPHIVFTEATPWEEMPGGEGYVWGCLITYDTQGATVTADVEYTSNNGSVTAAASLSLVASGRRKIAYSWGAVLAQQIRLRPTGACLPWIRYKIEWLTDPEPPRIPGWNTNWENFGSYADKWLKGYLLEADTFNVAKTVVIDIDQALAVQSNALTFNGRGIQQIAFAKQRGRLFRLRATDANYGKFYRWQPIFDEEPLALTRWESEERPFPGMEGRWQKPIEAFVTLRSSAQVDWQIITYGEPGAALNTSTYAIPSTGGVKMKRSVNFNATKGVLFAHLFTSASPFWLYREESEVRVEDWESGDDKWVPLFLANDDLDPARTMGNAVVAASTPGGA